MIGDLNVTLDPHLDRTNYKTNNHIKAREVINSWLLNEDYVDVYIYFYPYTKGYTYKSDSDKNQKAQLDYVLVSPDLTEKIIDIQHKFTISSGHASITIEIATDIERQGQGIF